MLKHDRLFLAICAISSLLIFGMVAENIKQSNQNVPIAKKIDIEKVKAKIHEAGLTPREAMYYQKIN